MSSLLAAAELFASAGSAGIVVIDDFGDGLDGDSASHLAATMRARAGQLWLTTRRAPVAEAFRRSEIVRLALDDERRRRVHHGREPTTKAARLAARHISLQLLPAVAARSVVLLEGAHDRASYSALAERLLRDEDRPLPSASRVAIADAGAVDGAGGASALQRIAEAAGDLGFFTVAVIDGDQGDQAERELQTLQESADMVFGYQTAGRWSSRSLMGSPTRRSARR